MRVYSILFASLLSLFLINACGSKSNTNIQDDSRIVTDVPIITVSAGPSQSVISWDAVGNATSYNLYYSLTIPLDLTTAVKVSGITSPYTHSGLNVGTPYFYVVTAITSAGEGGPSNLGFAVPTAGQPILVSVTAHISGITVSWTPTASTVLKAYNIYYGTSSGVTVGNGTKISDIPDSPFTITGIDPMLIYYVIVTTLTAGGESIPSIEAATSAPPIPAGLGIVSDTEKNTLTWENATGAISYNIYYSNSLPMTKATGIKISNVTSPYVHSGLTNGIPYFYIVTSVNASAESNDSGIVYGMPSAGGSATATLTQKLNGIWVVGGLSGSTMSTVISSIDLFDPASGVEKWYPDIAATAGGATYMPVSFAAVECITATIGDLPGSKLIIIGGFMSDGTIGPVQIYDITTNVWLPNGMSPAYPVANASCVVEGGRILLIGGTTGNAASAFAGVPVAGSVQEYDPVYNVWAIRAPMLVTGDGRAGTILFGVVYNGGGRTTAAAVSATFESFLLNQGVGGTHTAGTAFTAAATGVSLAAWAPSNIFSSASPVIWKMGGVSTITGTTGNYILQGNTVWTPLPLASNWQYSFYPFTVWNTVTTGLPAPTSYAAVIALPGNGDIWYFGGNTSTVSTPVASSQTLKSNMTQSSSSVSFTSMAGAKTMPTARWAHNAVTPQGK